MKTRIFIFFRRTLIQVSISQCFNVSDCVCRNKSSLQIVFSKYFRCMFVPDLHMNRDIMHKKNNNKTNSMHNSLSVFPLLCFFVLYMRIHMCMGLHMISGRDFKVKSLRMSKGTSQTHGLPAGWDLFNLSLIGKHKIHSKLALTRAKSRL